MPCIFDAINLYDSRSDYISGIGNQFVYTHNMENIIANRIEFVSSFAMGCMIFIIRTLLHISCNSMMIGIMSIVVGFFLMSFYVVIRMVLFNTIRIVNLMQHSKKPCSKKHMLKKEK